MRKRRIYLILGVVAVVLAGVLVAVLSREREPEYGGKRLSEWVKQLDYDTSRPINDEAAHALHRIGTNALPFLLKWIRYETPPWKQKLYRVLASTLANVNPNWEIDDRNNDRAGRAMAAFTALGSDADGAIPELALLLNDPKAHWGAVRAANVLVGRGKTGLPALLAGLEHQDPKLRCFIALKIGFLRTNALPAVPALLKSLADSDARVRGAATNALQKIDPEALERAIP